MQRYFSAAADRESQLPEWVVRSNSGIWNTDLYPFSAVPDDALADSLNIYPGTFKRGGKTFSITVSTGTSQVTGVHFYVRSGASTLTVFAKGTSAYYNGASSVSTFDTSLTANDMEFVTYQDGNLYYVNGDNGLRYWTGSGTAATVSAYTPSASEPANYLADSSHAIHDSKYIAMHEKVMYVADDTTLYRCDEIQGPSYWHHKVQFPTPKAGKLKWLQSFNGVLVVFKEDSIHKVDGFVGDGTFATKVLHADVGCASGRTVVEVPGLGLVFMAHDKHFYVLRPEYVQGENIPLFRLSTHISNLVDAISSTTNAAAGIKNGRYYCSVQASSSSSANDKALVFDYTKVAAMPNDPTSLFVPWGVDSSVCARCFARNGTTLYAGESDDIATTGRTDVVEVDREDAASYYFILRPFLGQNSRNPGGYPHRDKMVHNWHLTVLRDTVAITPAVSVDVGAFSNLDAFTPTYSGSGLVYALAFTGANNNQYDAYTIPVYKMGKGFQFKVTSAGEVVEMRFEYEVLQTRG